MSACDLLIEIGTEELPPKALKGLSEAFGAGVREGLTKASLAFANVQLYAAPRRLAVFVQGLATTQPDRMLERRGPALNAAFDKDGNPTPALQGFARSCGVAIDALERQETDKGAWLVYRSAQPGQPAEALIPGIVQAALDALPIPRRMRWGSLRTEFVRPVHWVVLLFGDQVIDAEILGIRTGRETRGHRFHAPAPLALAAPADYARRLESEGRVIADFSVRRESVRVQVLAAATQLGGRAVIDEDLLDEVTAMVEWPRAICGNFEARFLEVPAEALISAMKGHQKYFHVLDAHGRLLPHFITVSNIESKNPAAVQAGNERVIRPRLADANFFWTQDRRQPLIAQLERLKDVVFQKKLGTLHDKARRVERLARTVAEAIGGEPGLAERAALLAKCDLMTAMVGEFPELQGIMGRYYALHDGESEEVAQALDEQYLPRQAGDRLPQTPTGQALAIADKLDTLVGIFGIGELPTGDKDPFGLRRAALGVLRMLVELRLPLDLSRLLEAAADGHGAVVKEGTAWQVYDFMMERLRGYYQQQGFAPDVFEAVLARRPTRPVDFDARLRAVAAFRTLPEAESLAAANKRIHNILRQAGGEISTQLDAGRLEAPAERQLAAALQTLSAEVHALFDRGDYEGALRRLATLRTPVDVFFDQVMVMVDDAAVRQNRLALLGQLHTLFLRVADLSRLQ